MATAYRADLPGTDTATTTLATVRRIAMTAKSIHIVAISSDDWTVREDGGRELGHYPSQQDALRVGRKLARTRKTQLLINDVSAETPPPEHQTKGLFARLFRR
jgi:uncharacterized protein DUF2188